MASTDEFRAPRQKVATTTYMLRWAWLGWAIGTGPPGTPPVAIVAMIRMSPERSDMTSQLNDTVLLSGGERLLSPRVIDHWDRLFLVLQDNPRLYSACRRLLKRFGQDMIRRIGLHVEADLESAHASAGHVTESQRKCDLVLLSRLLPSIEAA